MERSVASIRSSLRRSTVVWNVGVSSILFMGFLAIASLGDANTSAGETAQLMTLGQLEGTSRPDSARQF
jgi:hypothetical protein